MQLKTKSPNSGFTIIELLVVVALSGIVMTAIYSAYYTQQKSYVTQGEVAEMQQNLRVGLFNLEREIRMAGYDPTGGAEAGIITANTSEMRIKMDIHDSADNDGDGRVDEPDETGNSDGAIDDPYEDRTIKLDDYDDDGDNDLVGKDQIQDPNNFYPIAQNIDALNFIYLTESGAVTTTISQIRSVQISIVARTGRGDPGYTNTTTFYNQQDAAIYTAPGDNYRRKILTAQVKCRNLGVQ